MVRGEESETAIRGPSYKDAQKKRYGEEALLGLQNWICFTGALPSNSSVATRVKLPSQRIIAVWISPEQKKETPERTHISEMCGELGRSHEDMSAPSQTLPFAFRSSPEMSLTPMEQPSMGILTEIDQVE